MSAALHYLRMYRLSSKIMYGHFLLMLKETWTQAKDTLQYKIYGASCSVTFTPGYCQLFVRNGDVEATGTTRAIIL